MRRSFVLAAVASLAIGCAASSEDSGSAVDALTAQTLTAQQCKTPSVTTRPLHDSSGSEIDGTALTKLTGCIVGRADESGAALNGRVATVLGDTDRIGHVRSTDNAPVFTRFTPGRARGTLATELVQDVDVELAMSGSPSARLRVKRKLSADGIYSLEIQNVTAFEATALIFPVTAIEAGNVKVSAQFTPEANGISVVGTGSVKLEVQTDQAGQASLLIRDVFAWLVGELAA